MTAGQILKAERAARTVIRSNGKATRVLLTQPPHFRTGLDAAPAVDMAGRAAARAIRSSHGSRTDNYRSNGSRPQGD